jgi:hypothetical protein
MSNVIIRHSKGILTAGQNRRSDQVHSDQMVFGRVRPEAGLQKRRPKALKTKLTLGEYQALVHSDQTVVVMVRQRQDLVRGSQRHSRESWKTTLGSQGT